MAIIESILTINERLWDWWSLYDCYYEIDDVYEKICYVKGPFSHYNDRSFVIIDVQEIFILIMTLCGQRLKKDDVYVHESLLLTEAVMFLMMFDYRS